MNFAGLTKFLSSVSFLSLPLLAFSGNYTHSNIDLYLDELNKLHTNQDQKEGLRIYTEQYLMDEGWHSMETIMEMELIDAKGNRSTREVVKKTIEEDSSPDKTLGIFLSPRGIKGTAMLTFEQSLGADNQWLYMPAIKRVKKINAQNKSGSFVGSEFSWEDISTTELTKYTYKLISDNKSHWVVQRTPLYDYSGYSRHVTWVDKTNYQTDKIEFYDKKGDLLKTLTLTDWRLYENRFWRPKHFDMVNHQNNKRTILKLSEYKLRNVDASSFTSLNLRRSASNIR